MFFKFYLQFYRVVIIFISFYDYPPTLRLILQVSGNCIDYNKLDSRLQHEIYLIKIILVALQLIEASILDATSSGREITLSQGLSVISEESSYIRDYQFRTECSRSVSRFQLYKIQ